jgi:hypothetical protein
MTTRLSTASPSAIRSGAETLAVGWSDRSARNAWISTGSIPGGIDGDRPHPAAIAGAPSFSPAEDGSRLLSSAAENAGTLPIQLPRLIAAIVAVWASDAAIPDGRSPPNSNRVGFPIADRSSGTGHCPERIALSPADWLWTSVLPVSGRSGKDQMTARRMGSAVRCIHSCAPDAVVWCRSMGLQCHLISVDLEKW